MLDKELCEKVLTVGCFYKRPTGGISQVLHTYGQHIFMPYKFVATTSKGGKLAKLCRLAASIVKFVVLMVLDRHIKIVHIHTASNNSFRRKSIFVNMGKAFGKRVVLHVHSGAFLDFYRRNQMAVKPILDKCDAVVALSDFWKEALQKQCGVSNVCVIDNVICHPGTTDKAVTKDKTRIHLLFLGLCKKEKGLFDLLDVFVNHQDELRGRCVLHVCCDKQDEVRRLAADAGVDDIVSSEGWVSGMDKERLLERCDVYVLPSYFEGVPISILECMSHGMAVLASKVGGIPSVVAQGRNGILFEAGNTGQLYDAVARLAGDRGLVGKMGAASRAMVKRYYPEHVAQELKELYESLL